MSRGTARASCLVLRGGYVAAGPDERLRADIMVRDGRVCPNPERFTEAPVIDVSGLLLLPGLVNAHDHLEFNLFPRLGNGPYPNALEWARDIYHPAQSPVREQLLVPAGTRLFWGGLKNLASGVTTVAHHNPLDPILEFGFPVRVVRRIGWAHSLAFGGDVFGRFRSTPPGWPFILHLGEGTDAASRDEIHCLDDGGALDARTVLVHAVALGPDGLALVRRRGAGIVWCPTSNLFTLGRTLGAPALSSGVPVALGSDSALTAEGDLLDELRAAHRLEVSPARAYGMVTNVAARLLRLCDGEGEIVPGGVADLVAVPDGGLSPALTLCNGAPPELVLLGGKVKLISPALAAQTDLPLRGFHTLALKGRRTVLVDAPVPELIRRVSSVLGPGLCLAGRRVDDAVPANQAPGRRGPTAPSYS